MQAVMSPVICQINQDRSARPLRVHVSYDDKNKEIVITQASELDTSKPYLYGPTNLDAITSSNLEGEVQLGSFALCESQTGKLLFILKARGDFWYPPGGLVDKKKDATIPDTAVREILEETGVAVNGALSIAYLYNSITPPRPGAPTRQNLMAVFINSGFYDTSQRVAPDEDSKAEIKDAKWWDPVDFWAMYMTKPKFSPQSIELCFSHFIDAKRAALFGINWLEYDALCGKDTAPLHKTLLDLSFLETIRNSPALSLQEAMAQATSRADSALAKKP